MCRHARQVPISCPSSFHRRAVGAPWFLVPHSGDMWGPGTGQIYGPCCILLRVWNDVSLVSEGI